MTCTLYREGLRREDIHKEPFTFRIQSFIAIGNSVNGSFTPVNVQPEVQSVCGVLNNILAFKKEQGEQLSMGEVGKKSKINDNQVEAKELIAVAHKTDKLYNGNYSLPESKSLLNSNLKNAVSELRMKNLMTLDPSMLTSL